MAYVFLLNNDNSITASHREVIMQREKLVNDIHFLVNPEYNMNDMSLFSVILEYVLPCSKAYHTLELVQDQEGYQEYLKYIVPLDTNLSSEAGDIELQLSFIFVGLDADGNGIQKVRKTKPTKLHITKISAWSDIIPDSALSSLDQRIIKTQAQINEIGYYAEILNENQVNNLKYDNKSETLQLMAGKKEIGDKVSVRDMIDDGIPVVNIDSVSDDSNVENKDGCSCGCEDNVVEFYDDELSDANPDDNVVEF